MKSSVLAKRNREKNQSPIRLWAVAAWLIAWQCASFVLSRAYTHGELLLASPAAVVKRLMELVITTEFWGVVFTSSLHIFGGFFAGCILAILLAGLSYRVRILRDLLAPLVAAVKAVPVVSFIILALIWLDSSALSLFISALMVFPPIYLNILAGLDATDVKLLEMADVFHVSRIRRIRGIYMPQLLPYFRSACSLALGLCWKSGAAAEVIGLPGGTIGERLYTAKVYFQTPDLFAWTAVIVAISIGFERVFLLWIDRIVKKVGA